MKIIGNHKVPVISIVIVTTYIATLFIPKFFAYVICGKESFNALAYYTKVLLCHGTELVVCFAVVYLLSSFSLKKTVEMLGLNKNIGIAFILALLAALPQLIGMQYLHGFKHGLIFQDVWINGIHPGYHEEIVFRGFLIGILVRYAKWPAIIPLVMSSLFFALGHLYQANNLTESIIVFLTAFGVGTGFYLLYKYSNWNLWFPLFLHSFMDTSTAISNWQGNITMSLQDNIFRGITIIIAIYICYRLYKAEKVKQRLQTGN